MTLSLSILRCPDAVPPETKRVSGGELRIGRGPDNDWIMPDPDRMLSKKHCVIAYRNGTWAVADTSTNGTFLNRDSDPIGQGQIRELADGDRLRFGAYEIEVRISLAQDYGQPAGGFGAAGGGFGGKAASPFDDPFGDDVFAPKPQPAADRFTQGAFGADPLYGGPSPQQSVSMPVRYDPLAAPSDDDFFGAPTQPDHSPAFNDAFKAPMAAPKLIPDDDWDLGFPSAPPAATTAPPRMPPPAPMARPGPPPVPPATASPFEEEDFPAAAMPVAPAPAPVMPAASVAAPPPTPIPAAAPAAVGVAGDLMAAFMAGAGLEGAMPADPMAAMRALGAAFRASVSGIRQALIARASIKGEFRIEQTMIRSRGNNPLKFSADDDDALGALLGIGRKVDMKPEAAMADALRDMRLHELATMAAMQNAVRALLTQLDPGKLKAEADGGMLPAQKKARAFEAYEKLHETVTRALADDFDSVFGKSFARAYENALAEISAKDKS